MHWLFLPLAVAALVLAFSTPHAGLMALALLASLAFLMLWLRGWFHARLGQGPRAPLVITPAELERPRRRADVRKTSSSGQDTRDPAPRRD